MTIDRAEAGGDAFMSKRRCILIMQRLLFVGVGMQPAIKLRSLGKADEIARGVLFLVADDAGFVTGSTMSINGGQHMY